MVQPAKAGELGGGKKVRRVLIWSAVLVVLLCCVGVLIAYLRSAAFEERVRQRVIAAVEQATGGRVELSSFHWSLSTLQFEARNFVIHGNEAAGERPFVSVSQVNVRLRLTSLLESRIDIGWLGLDRPQVHILRYRDGSTNVPEPKGPAASAHDSLQTLFDMAIGRAQVAEGLLEIDEQKIPFEGEADGIRGVERYSRLHKRYDATLHVGKVDVRYGGFRDVALQADLDFSLWRNRAEIKSLKLRSQNSTLNCAGAVENFDDPRLSGRFDLYLDLPQSASIARVRGVESGVAELHGSGSYGAGRYASSGTLQLRDLSYSGSPVKVRRASAGADYNVDNTLLQLRKISAHVFNGDVRGEAAVRNYNSNRAEARPQPGKRKNSSVQDGSVHLDITRLSLEELAQAVSSPAFRMNEIALQADVRGAVNAAWKESFSRAIADLQVELEPPEQVTGGRLPVSGRIHGSYDLRDDSLTLQTLALSTPKSQLEASGRLAKEAALDVSFTTTGLAELRNVISAIEARAIPIALSGQASFKGKLSGRLREPRVAGHFEADNLGYVYMARNASHEHVSESTEAAALKQPTLRSARIDLDSIAGDVQYSSDALGLHHVVAKQGDATATIDGTVSLQNGDINEDLPFEGKAHVSDLDVDRLQQMLGTEYPVKGKLNAVIHGAGSMAHPRADGSLSLSAAEAYGRSLDTASAHFGFADDRLAFSDLRVRFPAGTVLGSGSYDIGAKTYTADLYTEDVDLAKVPDLQREKLSTAGRGSITAMISGTLEQPVINAHISVKDLKLNDENVGALNIDAVTHGDRLQVTAHSNFQRAKLDLDGTVHLRGNAESDLKLQFSDLDIDPFLSMELKGHVTEHSGVAGRAQVSGPLREPRLLQGTATIDTFAVTVEKIPIKNEGPIEVTLANQVVAVRQFALLSTDSRFTAEGTVDLRDERPLNLHLGGTVSLLLAETFDPELTSSGTMHVDANLRGTVQDPNLIGTITIAKGSFSNIELPAALTDVNGTLIFNQNRLEVKDLTGHVGGGNVSFGGYISYGKAIGFDLSSQGSDVRFRYAGLSVTADQEFRLQGNLKNATVSGRITITRFSQIPSSDLAALFAATPGQVPNVSSPLNNLHLDIRILSSPELTVQTSLAKLTGDADLRLRGTALHPILLGRVSLAQGDVKLNGSKYRLERGDIYFANPVRIDPILDIEATTRVRDFDITIGIHGTMERLVTTYRSDPPLSSDDIIALLAFGRTQTENSMANSGSSGGFGEAASSAVLGAAINQMVSNRVSRLFGVSSIRINPAAGTGPDNNPNARLTVEQQVSKDVTITYITNLARSSQQVIQFEYNIARDYTVEAIRDENGVVSFDLLIRKRKK